jgi:hypothetical protein
MLVLVWVILSVLVGVYATSRGHGFFASFCISLILSPLIAFLILLVRKPNTKAIEERAIADGGSRKCPQCAELIKAEAIVCRYCNARLDAPEAGPPASPTDAPTTPAPADAEELMRRLEITREGGKYHWRIWKYDRLEDAVAYAEKVRAEERVKYGA